MKEWKVHAPGVKGQNLKAFDIFVGFINVYQGQRKEKKQDKLNCVLITGRFGSTFIG